VISCRVLGPVEVTVDGAAAPPELLWRKHLALLLYLARSPKRARTREHLTGLLWPETTDSAARHSLNEALRVLRRSAGDEALDTSGGQIRLSADAVRLDADQLDGWIASENWDALGGAIAGEFLEGFSVAGSDGLEDWLMNERRYWNGRAATALLGWTNALLSEGRADEALAVARRAQALEPRSESAVRAAMTCHAVLGDPGAALAEGDRFAKSLADEVGGAPSEETRALIARILGGRGPRPDTAPPRGEETGRRRAPLVGRGAELGRLLTVWERCCDGGGAAAVVLTGDGGTGKTRLLAEFSTRAALTGATVALVRAVPGDLENSSSALVGLARGGLLNAPGLAAAPPEALAAFATLLPEWADRFHPRAAAVPLRQALAPVLAAALGEGPLLLVVDDAHWADGESLLALAAALRDLAPLCVCLVLAALPAPPRAEIDELLRRLGGDVPGEAIAVSPLDGTALRQLAAWALPTYDMVALERVCRRVSSDSAGLPFLAVELLSAVASGLDLKEGGAAWPAPMHTLTQSLPGDLPDTVVAALRIGFRRLSPDAQRVLSAAAVLDQPVDEAGLSRATELAAPALQSALDELEWQRWLEVSGRGYGFVADLARQVIARDMLTPGQRARLQARAEVSS